MTNDEPQDLRHSISLISTGETLSEEQAAAAFDIIMSGDATLSQIGAFLMGLSLRGETVAEITGAARIMRAKMIPVRAPENALDVVGTGGDRFGTQNISTATAFVVAGCGVPIAKHGNRAASSKSGAADVLSALGVNLDAGVETVERAIREAGIGFLMAPSYHASMRHVGPARAELGIRTIFNILGPLANPASVRRLLVGTFDRKWVEPMASVLNNLGVERAWVIHGDGMDELSTTGPSHVAELRGGTISTMEITPADAGIPTARIDDLLGGSPDENAAAIRAVFDGNPGAFRDIVLYNAAAALLIADIVEDLPSGVARATEAIDSGAAAGTLAKLSKITQQNEGTP